MGLPEVQKVLRWV